MKSLKRLYYKLFKHYERIDIKWLSYDEADSLIKKNADGPEEYRWHIAKEEDHNTQLGVVWIERKRRIYE